MPVEKHQPSHPFLRSMINHILFQELLPDDTPGEWMRILPNGTTNWCFTLSDRLLSMEYGVMANNMSTTCIRPVTFSTNRRISMIVVQFRPYAFHLFTGVPMREFTNGFPEHTEFFSASRMERLYGRLYEAPDPLERVRTLEQFLMQSWRIRQSDPRMGYLNQQIMRNPGSEINSLADSVNLSTRRLRDLFIRQVGISPKYFSKLIRFTQATRTIASDWDASLTSIALDLGYYDQAHFNHEFREFGGITPGEFKKTKFRTSDFYNFSS